MDLCGVLLVAYRVLNFELIMIECLSFELIRILFCIESVKLQTAITNTRDQRCTCSTLALQVILLLCGQCLRSSINSLANLPRPGVDSFRDLGDGTVRRINWRSALGYPPETEAHKAGREAVEAVNETVDGAVKTVHDAIVPEPAKPKPVGEVAYEGVAETATQMKEATSQAIDQVKEAVHPTPPPKTAGEVVGETIDKIS